MWCVRMLVTVGLLRDDSGMPLPQSLRVLADEVRVDLDRWRERRRARVAPCAICRTPLDPIRPLLRECCSAECEGEWADRMAF